MAIIGCGPRPIIADAPASRLTNTATEPASVSGSITPTISPISPYRRPRLPPDARKKKKEPPLHPFYLFFRQCRCCRWPLDGHYVLRPQASLDHLGGVVERVRRTPNPDLRHQRAKLGTHPLGMPQPGLVVVREHRYRPTRQRLTQAARHVPAPCGTATALIPSPASTEASCSPSHKVIQPPGRDALTGKDQIRASRPVGPPTCSFWMPARDGSRGGGGTDCSDAELDLRKFASNAIRPGTGLRITCRAETTAHRTTGGM